MSVPSSPNQRPAWRHPLALLTAACVVAGVLARFWGLGKWPLAIDEYYFARSVQNVLHSGLPRYPCDGLYLRGLLLQYISALLQMAGASAELGPRLIAAVASLLTLPAAYLVGRRVGGRRIGLLAVAILALSVWEVEIARFGRMYAPFQAVFAWYLVFFLRYSLDGKRSALAPMLVLSAIGLFVWEGGIFLLLSNFLPPFIANESGRLRRRDWLYLFGAACVLFIAAGPLVLADVFPVNGGGPLLPADYHPAQDVVSLSRLDAAVMPWTTLQAHPVWAMVALLPALLIVYAIVQRVRRRSSPLEPVGLIPVLACAALQQFELAAGLIVILLLLRIVQLRRIVGGDARSFQVALLACVIFWVAFALGTRDWHVPGLSPVHTVLLLGYEFAAFPDTVREVAMPWARTVPMLGLGLFVLIGAACVRACWRAEDTPVAERVLLALFVLLLFAASSVHPPRHETRYVFFLYPLAVILALTTVTRATRAMLGPPRTAAFVSVAICVALFALSEDFRPLHLWNIDTYDVNFRIGMSGRVAGHYHPRNDVRGAADWLRAHVVPGRDIVIESFPGVDFYYPGDFYYIAETDPRFEVWSCRRGTVQRWSNLPMIHSFEPLGALVGTGRRVWMVFESSRVAPVLTQFPPTDWTVEWSSRAGDIVIVAFQEPAGA